MIIEFNPGLYGIQQTPYLHGNGLGVVATSFVLGVSDISYCLKEELAFNKNDVELAFNKNDVELAFNKNDVELAFNLECKDV